MRNVMRALINPTAIAIRLPFVIHALNSLNDYGARSYKVLALAGSAPIFGQTPLTSR